MLKCFNTCKLWILPKWGRWPSQPRLCGVSATGYNQIPRVRLLLLNCGGEGLRAQPGWVLWGDRGFLTWRWVCSYQGMRWGVFRNGGSRHCEGVCCRRIAYLRPADLNILLSQPSLTTSGWKDSNLRELRWLWGHAMVLESRLPFCHFIRFSLAFFIL